LVVLNLRRTETVERSPMSTSIHDDLPDAVLARQLRQALQGIRYGSVEIIVHDGRIVQIERREKLRVEAAPIVRPKDGPGPPGSGS
jgi:hypothetical protein